MEEADFYDEFGNYIGPVEDETAGTNHKYSDNENDSYNVNDTDMQAETTYTSVTAYTSSNSVVLHEDKKYFPSASEVYGETVQVLVEEEDAQPLTEPIIAPVKEIIVDSVSAVQLKYSME